MAMGAIGNCIPYVAMYADSDVSTHQVQCGSGKLEFKGSVSSNQRLPFGHFKTQESSVQLR